MSFRPFRGNADNWRGRGRGGGPRGFNLGNQDDDDDEPYTKRERSPVRVIRRTRIDDNDDVVPAAGGPGPERGRPFQRGGSRGGSNFERGGRGSWNRGRGGGQNSGFRNQDDQDSFRQENQPAPMPIKRDAFDDQGLGNGAMDPTFMSRRNLMSKPVDVPKTTWELNQEAWGIPSLGNEKRGNDSKSPWNSKPNPDRPSLLKPNYLAGNENSSNRPGQLPSLMSQPIMNPATPGPSVGMMQGNSNPWVRQGNNSVPQNNLSQWNAGGLMGTPQPLMAQPPFQNPHPLMIAPTQPNFGHNSNPMDGVPQVTPSYNPNNAPAFYSGNIPSYQDPGGAPPRVPPPPPKLNNSSRFISKPPVRYFNAMESPEKSSIASEASSVEVIGTKRRNENTSQSAPPPPPPISTLDKSKVPPSSEKVPTDPVVDLTETEEDDIETIFMELSTTYDLMQVTTKPRWRNTAQGVKHYAFNIQFEYKDQHVEVEGSYVKELKKAREEAYGLACQKVKLLVEKEEITSTSDKSKPVGGTMQRESTAADMHEKSGLSKGFRSRDSWSHQSAGSEVASKSNSVPTEPKKTPFVPLQRPPPPPPPKIGAEIRVGQQIDDSDFQSFDEGKKTSLQAQRPELIDEVIHLSRKRPFHSTAGTGSAFEERFKQYMDVLHMRCWLTPKRKTERSLRLTTYEIKIESFDGQFNTQYSGDPFLTDALAKEHAFDSACRGLEKIFPDVGRHGGAGEESTKQTEFDELRLKLRMEYRSYPDLKIEKNGAKMYGYNIEIYRGNERETVYGTFYPDEKHAKAATFEAAYHRLKYRYGPELDRLKNSQSANDLSRVSPSRTPIYNGEDDDEQDQPSGEWQSASVNNTTNDRNAGNRVTSPSFAFVSPMQKPTTFTNLFRQQPPPPPPPPRNNVMQGSGPPPTPRQDFFEPPPTPRDDLHSYNHSQNSFQNISNDGKRTFESRFLEYTRLLNIEYNFRLIPQFEAGYRIYAGEIKYQTQSGRFSPNIIMGEYYRDEQQARENAFKFAFEELDIKFKRQMNMMGVNTPMAPLTFGGSGRFMGR